MSLPTAAAARKAVPIFSGVIRYFPNALMAVAELSRVGNEQHNPGKTLFWDRSKSGDELDALTRHLVDAGTVDTDGVLHSTKVAWRALANLEKEIEKATTKEASVVSEGVRKFGNTWSAWSDQSSDMNLLCRDCGETYGMHTGSGAGTDCPPKMEAA